MRRKVRWAIQREWVVCGLDPERLQMVVTLQVTTLRSRPSLSTTCTHYVAIVSGNNWGTACSLNGTRRPRPSRETGTLTSNAAVYGGAESAPEESLHSCNACARFMHSLRLLKPFAGPGGAFTPGGAANPRTSCGPLAWASSLSTPRPNA